MLALDNLSHKSAIDALTEGATHGACTSLYVPVEPGETLAQVRQKLTIQLSEAATYLQSVKDPQEQLDYFRPLKQAVDQLTLPPHVKGVGLFRSPDHFFYAPLQLAPPSLAVVADSFHIKPVLQSLTATPHCYALAISLRHLKVFRVAGLAVEPLQIYANPFWDSEDESSTIGSRKQQKEQNDRFVRQVVKLMVKDVEMHRKSVAIFGPKVLRRRLQSELRNRHKMDCFLETTMTGSLDEMATVIQPRLEAIYQKATHQTAVTLANTVEKGLLANSLGDIAAAAIEGRIETLIVDPAVQLWGFYDRELGEFVTHDRQMSHKDDCVLDDIVEEVVKRNGEIIFVDAQEMGGVAPYLAKLRW